jgi:uncharacterized protein (TIGR02118 family)
MGAGRQFAPAGVWLGDNMIKRMGFVKRKAGMTLEAFHDYWLSVHAPLAAKAPGLRQYIVSTTIAGEGLSYTPAFDGLAEFWYDDMAALAAAEASPEWLATRADSPSFIGSVAALFTTEVPIIDDGRPVRERESWIKYIGLLTRKQGSTVDEMQSHWRDVHAPLVCGEFTTMVRYVQSHALPETYGTARHPAYDGVPEAWFRTLADLPGPILGRAPDAAPTPAGLDSAATFELPIPVMVAREHVIIG